MSNIKYTAEDWQKVDPMLATLPVPEIAKMTGMSTDILRLRRIKLGLPVIIAPRKKKMKRKEVNQLMASWRRPACLAS